MTYNKKLIMLLSITAALALVYALSLVFEPERAVSRTASYTWLDPKLAPGISGITITHSAASGAGASIELVRKNSEWFVSHNNRDYPAKALRIEDFIGTLTKRAPYPARSSSAASHERLGLGESSASRIIVSGGSGPLLDLLVGQGDKTGREVFLRRQGENEVRSGEDIFTVYVSSPRSSWYNLRLLPQSEDGGPDLDSVQRLTADNGALTDGGGHRVFARNGGEWTFEGMNIADPDISKVDSYIRGILALEGDDFSDSVEPGDPLLNHSRIRLELGDGSVKTLRFGPPDEDGRRYAAVSDFPFVFSLAPWAAERLFKEAAFFEKAP